MRGEFTGALVGQILDFSAVAAIDLWKSLPPVRTASFRPCTRGLAYSTLPRLTAPVPSPKRLTEDGESRRRFHMGHMLRSLVPVNRAGRHSSSSPCSTPWNSLLGLVQLALALGGLEHVGPGPGAGRAGPCRGAPRAGHRAGRAGRCHPLPGARRLRLPSRAAGQRDLQPDHGTGRGSEFPGRVSGGPGDTAGQRGGRRRPQALRGGGCRRPARRRPASGPGRGLPGTSGGSHRKVPPRPGGECPLAQCRDGNRGHPRSSHWRCGWGAGPCA